MDFINSAVSTLEVLIITEQFYVFDFNSETKYVLKSWVAAER